MPRQQKVYYKDAFHHAYNRGAGKQLIFRDSDDYSYFLARLKFYKKRYNIDILSYCLMPNHWHLQTKQLGDATLGEMVQYLTNGYTLYFNEKYSASGHLFQGSFKAKLIEKHSYLSYISLYIHTNPLELGYNVKNLSDYPWSSYAEYIGARNGTLPNKKHIFDLTGFDEEYYREFVEDGIPARKEKIVSKYLVD